jgi:hypothetical protein
MRHYHTVFLSAIFIVVFPVLVFADFNKTEWEYRSPVSGFSGSPEFSVLEIPSEVFGRVHAGLSDLRVIADGEEVPFVISVEKESESVEYYTTRIFNKTFSPGGDTMFAVDLGKEGLLHNRLTINISSENFRRIVTVEGSNDQATWRFLTDRGQIYDYTVRDIKPLKATDTSVSYPEATFRYLRITIRDVGESPLAVYGVQIERRTKTAAEEIMYDPSVEVAESAADRATDIILDLSVSGLPHRRGIIKTSDVNFNRAIFIYTGDNKNDWQLLTQQAIYRIQTPKFNGELLSFSYPETNRRYVKISVLNRDDRPIRIDGVSLFGLARKIIFRYDPAKTFYLYYGNVAARSPQYDLGLFSRYLDTANLNRLSLGSSEKNPDFIAPIPPKEPLTERLPYLLSITLGIVVAILAFLLLRLFLKPGQKLINGNQ